MLRNPSVTATKPATDDAGEGDDYWTFLCWNCGMNRHGSVNGGSGTLSVFLNFALTKVWVPQWGACRDWRFGDLISVHM